ncbi:MAG: NAD(P)H-dependent oxidoreductase [Kurthia sp.]|nr:NAD(P)H-dependent oxidoreductase [Candidatus Kurthia equi]
MTTLIIFTHPKLEASKVNKYWLQQLEKYPDQYTIHTLYDKYPDGKIDVVAEQKLLLQHEIVVLQFPVFWFSSPPLLKKWLDDVFVPGFSHGENGYQLEGKKFALAVTAGIQMNDYSVYGRYKYTMEQVLTPFVATFLYCKIDYRSYFAFYGHETPTDASPTDENSVNEEELQQSASDYLHFLESL